MRQYFERQQTGKFTQRHCPLLAVKCTLPFPLSFGANKNAKLKKKKQHKKNWSFHQQTLTETTRGTFHCSKILSPLANARENKLQSLYAVVLISCGGFERVAWNHVSLSQISRLKSALLDHLSEGNDRRINHFGMKWVTD